MKLLKYLNEYSAARNIRNATALSNIKKTIKINLYKLKSNVQIAVNRKTIK